MSTISAEQALQLAMTWHKAGQFALAESLYRQVLAAQPNHLEALHRLGTLKLATNQGQEAAEFFSRAAAEAPLEARFHLALGAAYRQLGRVEEALACEERARGVDHASSNVPDRGRTGAIGRSRGSARRLFCATPPPAACGWGVCMTHLLKEFGQHVEVLRPESFKNPVTEFDGPVFMPLVDCEFNPYSPERGTRNYGYVFFEFELKPNAPAKAALYDVVFCGSTWCLERMRERGIGNGKVLVQGVDQQVFHPAGTARPTLDDAPRIFSGGKFEFRKGQDVVIAAFRELLRKHPRARLVCAWHNLWPGLLASIKQSAHIAVPDGHFPNQTALFREVLLMNGIPEANFEILPLLSQTELADAMRSTDFGVFPNRCEGGTNLVLMEYLACGRPAVATASTGHADVVTPENALTLPPHLTREFWDEPDVAEVADAMDRLVESDALRAKLGAAGAESMRQWTWSRSAQTVLDTIFPAGD